MISVHDLSKKNGSQQALKKISINFEIGHVYGIVGENGAGKTTWGSCRLVLSSFRK